MAALAPLASSLLRPAIAPPQGGDVHSTRTPGDDAADAASSHQQRAAVETQAPPAPPQALPQEPPQPQPQPQPQPPPPSLPLPPQPLSPDGAKPHGAIPARSNQQELDDMLGLLRIFVYSTIALVAVLCVVTLLFVYHSFRR